MSRARMQRREERMTAFLALGVLNKLAVAVETNLLGSEWPCEGVLPPRKNLSF